MKTYKFSIELKEGCDEFWEDIKGSGVKEVENWITSIISENFGNEDISVKLIEFKDDTEK
jgi:hypothetical protein